MKNKYEVPTLRELIDSAPEKFGDRTFDAKNEIFRINYIHRLSAYSRQDIEAFLAGAAGAIFAGASAPEKTLREITEG